jgi:two-component system alkaline phosphatase synthesis response regulator PhoP
VKALVVDDEQSLLNMYESSLKMAGMEVVTASDGPSGIEIAKQEKPAIILLDIIMPKMNGLDVLKALKEAPETKDIPVMLLTNLPEECSGEKAKQLGANAYLVKAEKEPRAVIEKIKTLIPSQT